MNEIEALVLGLVQGLTEYLPVSSSGHLTIASHLFGLQDGEDNLAFTVAVHVATVLSTIVILYKEIWQILRGTFTFGPKVNDEQKYVLCILLSMIPIGIVGVCFKEQVEAVFGSGLVVVGCCLLLTAALLSFSYYSKPRERQQITYKDAFIIGLAQAIAVLPGLSRSGSTIGTGLILGVSKEKLAQFSFLMVIPPILGEALLDILKAMKGAEVMGDISVSALVVGFLSAFISGCFACKVMINLVKRGKMIWFAAYCAVVGILTIILNQLQSLFRMDYQEGEILCFDKPLGWTSFALVGKVRWLLCRQLGIKKLKVGHAGTLDPLATGVLVLCTGRATKRIDELQAHTKEYVATLRLGATTPSYDLEHAIDKTYPWRHITREQVEHVLREQFTGTIQQVPPTFSACKVNGDRAYDLARKGREVDLKPKTLVIDEIELLRCHLPVELGDDAALSPDAADFPAIDIRVVCSKGTYIRALARDIGEALGSGAHLTALRRTRVGDVRVEDCWQLEDFIDSLNIESFNNNNKI